MTCRGASLERKNVHGRTPLLTAAINGSIKCMQLLIQNGADVTTTDDYKRNIVHCIVINQDLDEVKVNYAYIKCTVGWP